MKRISGQQTINFDLKLVMSDLRVYALTEVLNIWKRSSTSVYVYVALLDANKAFDKINHWILFKKLISRCEPSYLVKTLCHWYPIQSMYVKWGSTLSEKFKVKNGVRQESTLSTLLFNVYVNELSECLIKSDIGGNTNGNVVNHMLFTDVIMYSFFIFSRSTTVVKQCNDNCDRHDLIFNAKKVNVHVFQHRFEQELRIPSNLCGQQLVYVNLLEKLNI